MLLICEATLALAIASAAVFFLPFRHSIRIASWALPTGGTAAGAAIAADVVWSVNALARRVPWRTVCFQKGLAAQAMLRRRGIDARLVYGIGKTEADELRGHVWVVSGDTALIGGDEAAVFQQIALFPS
jgi:hypothetical protein